VKQKVKQEERRKVADGKQPFFLKVSPPEPARCLLSWTAHLLKAAHVMGVAVGIVADSVPYCHPQKRDVKRRELEQR
jgi:hypothetical protein